MRIACIQMDIISGAVQSNLNRSMEFMANVMDKKPDIICLPELFTTGYCLTEAKRLAEPIPGHTTHLLSQKSREMGCFLIGGSIMEQGDNGIYNTAVIFDRTGRIRAKYRKMHLFAPFDEPEYLTPGDGTITVETEWGKVSVVICYDLRFPELFTELAATGVRIIFVVAEFPHPRLTDWKTLLMSRAIDNHIYVIGVNRVGKDEKSSFFGHTLIVSPSGEIMGEMEENEGVLVVDVEVDEW
ncbi:carbon-nitrogen family hydrolase [Candidatus Desantisbacteria bacterium]|nr:carbon-nitrogen family hydrolase [Candidatus Desantisbacteria bacterium]